MHSNLKTIYDRDYSQGRYSRSAKLTASDHAQYHDVEQFVARYGLHQQRCLEIGCGRGVFQDMVHNYIGIDVSEVAGRSLRKPFSVASASELPFPDNSFDAAWTIATLEHVPNPELTLRELRRVLRPNSYLLLSPAWHCRPWAAQGYAVRPYSEFNWRGKLVKASIPVRNSLAWRVPGTVLYRVTHLLYWTVTRCPTQFLYGLLTPDYVHNWTSDSDAVNSMDPFEAILWFISRGDRCISYPTLRKSFLVRTGGVVFQIQKR